MDSINIISKAWKLKERSSGLTVSAASQWWWNERIDGEMLVNDGEMLVNDGEMSVWPYTHSHHWLAFHHH